MALLKQLDRAAKVAWCPSTKFPSLLVSGTIAGTIDDSFESKAQLEIYDLDLGRSVGSSFSNDFKLRGATTTKDCFHSIAWGTKGIEDGSLPYGLLAGGMSDGSVNIWNPAHIINGQKDALLSRSDVHKGQVLGMQFHPTEPNLLASGATDGEVYIWDLASVSAPKPSKPHAQPKTSSPGITAIAWNKKVMQILASTNELGETSVWDLRQKRAIIQFRNSNRIQVKAMGLSWNPDASVQLAVCYANHPVAEVWDLRQALTPKSRFEGGHAGSILGLDWCPHDSQVLLTTGEDQRVIAWQPHTGQFLTEYALNNISFDLQWHPTVPGILSSASYDGKVSVHAINHTGLGHVPQWLKRPSGVSFGFGGRMASFGYEDPKAKALAAAAGGVKSAPPSPKQKIAPKINISQVISDPTLLHQSDALQSVLTQGQYSEFCRHKLSTASTPQDIATWTFMDILFQDPNAHRALLLKELGFESKADGSGPLSVVSTPTNKAPAADIPEDNFFDQAFTESLPPETNGVEEPSSESVSSSSSSSSDVQPAKSPHNKQSAPPVVPSGEFVESAEDKKIREYLVFGDFRGAVDKCLKAGRMADAILFASFGPPELWEETRNAYFAQHKNPFIRNTMKSVINRDMTTMVHESDLKNWRQTLAVLITYTNGDIYRDTVNQLGGRLESAGDIAAAVVCYMCASNIDKAIEIWSRHSSSFQDAIEKITMLAQAAQKSGPIQSRYLSSKFSEYAGVLAGEGGLVAAWNYLCIVSQTNQSATAADNNTSMLLDRIFHAQTIDPAADQRAPPFPFAVEPVGVDPRLNQAQQEYNAIKAQKDARIQQTQQAAQQHRPTLAGSQGIGAPISQAPGFHPAAAPNTGYPSHAPSPAAPAGYGAAPVSGGSYASHPHAGAAGYPGVGAGPAGYAGTAAAPQRGGYNPSAPTGVGAYPPASHSAQPGPGAPGGPSGVPNRFGAPGPSPPTGQPVGNAGYNVAPQNPAGQGQGGFYPPASGAGNTPSYGHPSAGPPPSASGFAHSAPHPSHSAPPHTFGGGSGPGPAAPGPTHFNPSGAGVAPNYSGASQPAPSPSSAASFAGSAGPGPAPGPGPAAAPPRLFTPAGPGPSAPTSSPSPPAPSPSSLSSSTAATSAPSVTPGSAPVQLVGDSKVQQDALEALVNKLLASNLKPMDAKRLSESRVKLNVLYRKLANSELSPSALSDLTSLCTAVNASDYATAQNHHMNLVRTEWTNNDEWLLALKLVLLTARKQFTGQ